MEDVDLLNLCYAINTSINVSFVPKGSLFDEISLDARKGVFFHLMDEIVEGSLLGHPFYESNSLLVGFEEAEDVLEQPFLVKPPDCFSRFNK